MNENLEEIGQAVDSIDNIIAALTLPLPAQMHLDSIKNLLPDISARIKAAIVQESGENPWEGWEDEDT